MGFLLFQKLDKSGSAATDRKIIINLQTIMTIRYKFPFKNVDLAEKVNKILAEYNVPLTLRQVYYRLVSIGLKNARNVYTNLSGKLSRLRERGMVSWESIIDLRRQPEKTPSWTSPKSFFVTVGQSYKRSLQQGQPNYTEVWCEKAVAISHIINKYDVPLLAGGGYRSSSALYDAAERIREQDKPGVILYMGDFDPSGLDIERDIKTKMEEVFHVEVEVQRVLLTFEDITDYDLLPNPVKRRIRGPASMSRGTALKTRTNSTPCHQTLYRKGWKKPSVENWTWTCS